MRGSEKKIFFTNQQKQKSFSLQQMKGIQYSIITEDVGWKGNHCNAKQLSKLKKSGQSI